MVVILAGYVPLPWPLDELCWIISVLKAPVSATADILCNPAIYIVRVSIVVAESVSVQNHSKTSLMERTCAVVLISLGMYIAGYIIIGSFSCQIP